MARPKPRKIAGPKRQMVVLDVPFEDDEDPPTQWKWGALIGTPRTVEVMGCGPIYKEPDEREDDD